MIYYYQWIFATYLHQQNFDGTYIYEALRVQKTTERKKVAEKFDPSPGEGSIFAP